MKGIKCILAYDFKGRVYAGSGHCNRHLEQKAERAHLQLKNQKRENKLEMGKAYELSKPAPSDELAPTKIYNLKVTRPPTMSATNCVQIHELYVRHFSFK